MKNNVSAADPVLNQIAKRTRDLEWIHPLEEGELAICSRLHSDPNANHRLVTILRDYKTWVVRTYLAGAQRTFGFFKADRQGGLSSAYRYADMVKMYFWPYKLRDAYEPGDHDLNISASRAKSDLIHETNAIQIIKDIEQHFKDIGVILTPQDKETQLQARIRQQRAKATVKSMLGDLTNVFQMRCDKWDEQMAEVTAELKRQGEVIERVNSFLAALYAAAQRPQVVDVGPGDYRPSYTGDPLPPQPHVTCSIPTVCRDNCRDSLGGVS